MGGRLTKTRVRLAPLVAADESEFLGAVTASRHLHRPWVKPADTPQRFSALAQRMAGPDNLGFLLRHRDGGALVGYVELTAIVRGIFQSAYLGYYAFAGHERQGLMREGLHLAARHAFSKLGLHRLEANIQPANGASIALVRSCGFQREGYSPRYLKIRGRWCDHERWALLAD